MLQMSANNLPKQKPWELSIIIYCIPPPKKQATLMINISNKELYY